MRILLFIILIFAKTYFLGQLNFDIQGKGLYNSTWIVNKSISDQGKSQDYDLGWGLSYGAGINFWLGKIGFGVEGIFGNHIAAYTGSVEIAGVNLNYNSKIEIQQSQIPLLLKIRGKRMGYFEVGVQMSSLSKATYNMEGDLSSVFLYPDDVFNRYSKTYMSALLGFGANIKPFKKFPLGVLIGARFQYGYSDLKGVDALGRSLDNSLLYDPYNSSHAISGGILLGLSYTLGKTN